MKSKISKDKLIDLALTVPAMVVMMVRKMGKNKMTDQEVNHE